MVALQTISPPPASVLQVHLIREVLAAGHHEAHSAILVPALLLIHQLHPIHQPLPTWVWPVRSTIPHRECRLPVQLSPLPRQHTVQRLPALVKLALLPHLRSTRPLLQVSPQPRRVTLLRRRSILRRRQRSVQRRQRLQLLLHTARRHRAGVPRRQLMQEPLADRPRLLPHNTRQRLPLLALRHRLSVQLLRLIRLLVQLSIHLRGLRALLPVRSIRQIVRRARSTLPTRQKMTKLTTRLTDVLYHQLSILVRWRHQCSCISCHGSWRIHSVDLLPLLWELSVAFILLCFLSRQVFLSPLNCISEARPRQGRFPGVSSGRSHHQRGVIGHQCGVRRQQAHLNRASASRS